MMVVCVELRIPLFLVGKPGSSKSLAKAIVADAMQGEQSSVALFKTLKEVSLMIMVTVKMKIIAIGVAVEIAVPWCLVSDNWFGDSEIIWS